MRRFLILMLALTLVSSFVACDSKTPEADTTAAQTEAPTDAPAEETTEALTEEPTEEPTAEETTEEPTAEETTAEWVEPEDVPYDVIESPVFNVGDGKALHGYNASGEFSFDEGDALSATDNNMFIVTNDRMAKGKLSATFTAPDQYVNDNGIIFGMAEDEYEQYYFWEDGPTYYFLFVSDDCTLYLAKVSDNGQPWTELQISQPIPNYKHGDTITISVEFDGEGAIDCYANDEWLLSYFDFDWSGGAAYGIRCEVPDVCYTEVIADHNWTPDW